MAFRAFVGVPVGPLPALVRLLEGLDASGADVRTVPAEQLHLTLAFLGQVPDEAAAPLAAALDEATRPFAAFDAQLSGVGAFPHARRPRVVWAGALDPRPLVTLALAVRGSLAAAGHPGDEKDFRAHVTLARVRSERDLDKIVAFLREHARDPLPTIPVREVRLYRSVLGPGGASHEIVHSAALEA